MVRQMVISKYGIAYNNGKAFMTWTQYLEVMKLFARDSVIEDIVKKINNFTEFSSMEFNQLQDQEAINRIAKYLGVKPTKTIDGTKSRIKKYLMGNNGENTDTDTFCRI